MRCSLFSLGGQKKPDISKSSYVFIWDFCKPALYFYERHSFSVAAKSTRSVGLYNLWSRMSGYRQCRRVLRRFYDSRDCWGPLLGELTARALARRSAFSAFNSFWRSEQNCDVLVNKRFYYYYLVLSSPFLSSGTTRHPRVTCTIFTLEYSDTFFF